MDEEHQPTAEIRVRERAIAGKLVGGNKWHLYEEESSDKSDWFFIGDRTNWRDPLIEFVPSELVVDKWRDYWLPHVSIDLDTNLGGEEIEGLIMQKFEGKVPPYRLVVVDGNICVMRARLGSVSGVNMFLDLGTKTRGTQYHRERLLMESRP